MGLLVVDNQYLSQSIAMINEAQKEICISTFKLERNEKPRGRRLQAFFDAIIQKLKSGVKVKVLFNWHDDKRCVPKTNYAASQSLKRYGADVRHLKNNRCCHAKLILVDKLKALLGSHNLSVRSCENNFELSYLIPDPESISHLSAIFESSFNDAQKINT